MLIVFLLLVLFLFFSVPNDGTSVAQMGEGNLDRSQYSIFFVKTGLAGIV
jgi:hypothetical protein